MRQSVPVEDIAIRDHIKFNYTPELDGLRGISILWVMIFHAGFPFMRGGFIGVDIFFVLSGFLITLLLILEFDGRGRISLRNFYIRRVLRLGPALVCLLIVYCIVSTLVLDSEKLKSNYVDALIALFYLSNWARAFAIHPPDFLGHTWSLSIEEQFYLIWPVFLIFLLNKSIKRSHIAMITILIAMFSWFFRLYLLYNDTSPERLYNGLDVRADGLMLGCFIGILVGSGYFKDNFRMTLKKILTIIAPVSMICLFIFSIVCYWKNPVMFAFGYIMVEILAVVLILDAMFGQKTMMRKFLSMRWLVWTGSISYGLYLWHYPVFRLMRALGFNLNVIMTAGIGITFIIATISYYGMERPILKIKKRYARACLSDKD